MSTHSEYMRKAKKYCFQHARRGCPLCQDNPFAPQHRPAKPKKKKTRRELALESRLDNAQLRGFVQRAMERDPHLTFLEIASRAEIVRTNGLPDTSRMRRALGMQHSISGRNPQGEQRYSVSTSIGEQMAVAIARAIHVDPWEIGV